jgi:maltokinase
MTVEPAHLSEWMTRQRWYAGKAHAPQFTELTSQVIPTDSRGVVIVNHLIMDHGGAVPTLYQVPVVERETPLANGESALIGITDAGISLYDGPHDPAYTAALARDFAPELVDRITGSAVMTGEQSNTSIVFSVADGASVICKVFRALHDGENPDVTLQGALSIAGSPFVPRFVGSIAAEWPDSGQPTGVAHGSLAFAQEFLPGAEDGWKLALRSTATDDAFSTHARGLGVATAEVHTTLAEVMPTQEATDENARGMLAAWDRRLALALREVPGLSVHAASIEQVYAAASDSDWPRLQRVHGDLHLGQALWIAERGWVLVDFEGEPLRPMNERDRPDSALRDVAGMLRSFDYAAGATPGWPVGWAAACRAAYLEGYAAASGIALEEHQSLLDAFELDKAVYEAIYEARNRPTWLGIPLRGIEQLLEASNVT